MEIKHPLVFKYFDGLPESRREPEFLRALQIGVVAVMKDRIAAFPARTENELGTHLESLKLIYERTVTVNEKTTQERMSVRTPPQIMLRNLRTASKTKSSKQSSVT